MKYFAFSVAFVFTAIMVHAQTNNPTLYTYRQKQAYDTLQMLFPDLQAGNEVAVQNNMPVFTMENKGVNAGITALGEVYSMKTDNMPCLKPFKTKDEIPNAMPQKGLVTVVPGKKR